MSHLITCSECDKPLQVPEELIGKKVQCPECMHTFIAALPDAETPSRRTAEPPPEPKRTEAGVSRKTQSDDERRDDERRDDEREPRRNRYDDDDERVERSIRRSRRRGDDKPGKVTGIGIMSLIGGILAVMLFLGLSGGSGGICCLWPGTYYSLVVGILAIIKGSALLGNSASAVPPPTGIGIMLIINIINLDITNVVLGILILVFCNDDEVKSYLAKG